MNFLCAETWRTGAFCACLLSRSVVPGSSRPRGPQPRSLLYPWNCPGKKAGVGHHALLQGIFLTQGPHKTPPNGFSSSFTFLRALHTGFCSGCPILKSYQQHTKLPASLLSHRYWMFSGVIFIFNLAVSHLLLWAVGSSPVVAWGLQSKPGLVVAACGVSCPTACGILVPQPGIEPGSPVLEDRFLITGPLGCLFSTPTP